MNQGNFSQNSESGIIIETGNLYSEKLVALLSPFVQEKFNETQQLLNELQTMVRPTTPPVLRDAYVNIHKAYSTVIDLKGKYLSQIHETIIFIPELQAINAFLMNRDLRSDRSFFDKKFYDAKNALNRSKLQIDQFIEETYTTKGMEWLIYAVRFLIGAKSYLEMARLENISAYRQIVSIYASYYCESLFKRYIEIAKKDPNGTQLRRKKQPIVNIAHSLVKHVDASASNLNLTKTEFQNREKEDLRVDVVYIMLPSMHGYLDEKAYIHAINTAMDAYNKIEYITTFSDKKSSTQIANENKVKQSQFVGVLHNIQDQGDFWGLLPLYSYEIAELKAKTYFQANKFLTSGLATSDVFIETLKQNLLDSEVFYYA